MKNIFTAQKVIINSFIRVGTFCFLQYMQQKILKLTLIITVSLMTFFRSATAALNYLKLKRETIMYLFLPIFGDAKIL